MTGPETESVLGTPLSLTNYGEVISLLNEPRADRASIVAVCNVHSVTTARRDPALRQALEQADVRTPDGVPLVWALRSFGHREQERVYGPELMRRAIVETDHHRHFLYGSTGQTLLLLEAQVHELNPSASVVGSLSPPFGPLDDSVLEEHAAMIRSTSADVVWVGLGMPKQELLMPRLAPLLPGTTLLGVGAAFDILAQVVRQAPPIVQRLGLEWAFRLIQEPRRLWRRYLLNNPAFLVLWLTELVARRRSATE